LTHNLMMLMFDFFPPLPQEVQQVVIVVIFHWPNVPQVESESMGDLPRVWFA
jgi:hypothetical protein